MAFLGTGLQLGCFLDQILINSPTTGIHILDLVLTNRPDNITAVHPMDNLPGTDHGSVEFTVCVYPPRQLINDKKLCNYKKADFRAFKELLFHVPFYSDIEDAWTCLKDLFFFAAVDSVIPTTRWN